MPACPGEFACRCRVPYAAPARGTGTMAPQRAHFTFLPAMAGLMLSERSHLGHCRLIAATLAWHARRDRNHKPPAKAAPEPINTTAASASQKYVLVSFTLAAAGGWSAGSPERICRSLKRTSIAACG